MKRQCELEMSGWIILVNSGEADYTIIMSFHLIMPPKIEAIMESLALQLRTAPLTAVKYTHRPLY